jgi:hypothetical protein
MENVIVEPTPDMGEATDSGNSFLESLDRAFEGIGEESFNTPTEQGFAEDPAEDPAEDLEDSEDTLGDVLGGEEYEDETAAPEDEEKDFLSSDDDEPADWTPKAAHRFQQLKAELKQQRSEVETLRRERAAYESQLQELKGAAESKNYEELEQKVAEYEAQRMLVDLENTNIYREAVAEPMEKLVSQAKDIAERYEVDADALLDAFALDNEVEQEEMLNELFAGASDRDKARIYRIIEDLNPIFERRTELYNNVEGALNEAQYLEEERANAQAAERARERTQVSKVVASRLVEKVPFIQSFEGVNLDKIAAAAAQVDFAAIDPVDGAYNAISGKLLPTFVKEYASLQKELDTLTERLAAYQNAEPGFDPTGSGDKRGPVQDEELGLSEALRRALG